MRVCSGKVEARPKSAARCTVWSAGISGAPRVAGRKPVSASPIEKKIQRFEASKNLRLSFLTLDYSWNCRGWWESLFLPFVPVFQKELKCIFYDLFL